MLQYKNNHTLSQGGLDIGLKVGILAEIHNMLHKCALLKHLWHTWLYHNWPPVLKHLWHTRFNDNWPSIFLTNLDTLTSRNLFQFSRLSSTKYAVCSRETTNKLIPHWCWACWERNWSCASRLDHNLKPGNYSWNIHSTISSLPCGLAGACLGEKLNFSATNKHCVFSAQLMCVLSLCESFFSCHDQTISWYFHDNQCQAEDYTTTHIDVSW